MRFILTFCWELKARTHPPGLEATHVIQKSFLHPLLQARLSKSPGVVALAARGLRNLAELDPAYALPQLLDGSLVESLAGETLSSPHHVQSALACLSALAPVMMQPTRYPEGPQRLKQILDLSLPGININDTIKTNTTLLLYQTVLTQLPLVDVPGDDTTVNGMLDWTLALLERVFLYISLLDAPEKKGNVSHLLSSVIRGSVPLRSVLLLLFSQMSESLFSQVEITLVVV